jgi:hypothetical protein
LRQSVKKLVKSGFLSTFLEQKRSKRGPQTYAEQTFGVEKAGQKWDKFRSPKLHLGRDAWLEITFQSPLKKTRAALSGRFSKMPKSVFFGGILGFFRAFSRGKKWEDSISLCELATRGRMG